VFRDDECRIWRANALANFATNLMRAKAGKNSNYTSNAASPPGMTASWKVLSPGWGKIVHAIPRASYTTRQWLD
jgi:hypothetical protein